MNRWWLALMVATGCTAQDAGMVGIDLGIDMSSGPPSALAVGAVYAFTFYDRCPSSRDGFCHPDGVRSIDSASVSGPFEVLPTSQLTRSIQVRATGPGMGALLVGVTDTEGETHHFRRDLRALVTDRASAKCLTLTESGPAYVFANAPIIRRTPGYELVVLSTELFAGTEPLYGDGFFPFDAPGFSIQSDQVVAPTTAGPVTMTASFDPSFMFSFEVYSIDQIDKLELLPRPRENQIYMPYQLVATVGGHQLCRPPWESLALTATPASVCSVSSPPDMPGKMPTVQWHDPTGPCHIEARLTGSSLVVAIDETY